MKNSTLRKNQPNIKARACPSNFNWTDNPDVQSLLDVISEIIANEYIEVAKQNENVFKIASSAASPPPPMTKLEVTNESSNIC